MNRFSSARDITAQFATGGPGMAINMLCNGLAGIRQHRVASSPGGRKIRGLYVCAACIAARDQRRAEVAA
jgi:hypothetical protein